MTNRRPNVWFCVYDPEEGFSGSRLHGYDFAKTLSDGHLPLGSIWFERRRSSTVVIEAARLLPDGLPHDRQVTVPCSETVVASFSLPVKRRIAEFSKPTPIRRPGDHRRLGQ